MLSRHDLEVIARDPALPGLVILLDHGQALGLVQQLYPEHGISDLSVSYLKYKPRTNCLAGFTAHTAHTAQSVQSTEEPLQISAKAYPEKEYAKQRARYTKAGRAGQNGGELLFIDAWQLVFWSFPRDRKIGVLNDLADAVGRRQLLLDLLPEAPELPERTELAQARLETLCYKSERRYVGRLVVEGEARALIKVYEEGDFNNACKAAQSISSFTAGDGLRLARPVALSQEKRIIVSQWLSGRPLRPQLFSAYAALQQNANHEKNHILNQVQAVGAALAAFHRQRPGSLAALAPENEALSVLAAANAAALLCPAPATRLRRLATRIAAELLSGPVQSCPIHGDFSADQVLVDAGKENSIAIVDYDQARIADPAVDFGSFMAQLLYDEAAGSLAVGSAERIGTTLLQGYLAACGNGQGAPRKDLSRRSLYTAAKLLQLAPQGFRSRHALWPELMARLLHSATLHWKNHARSQARK